LTFVFNIVLARLLGAEGTGVYYLALTVTSIATVIGRMGLDNALVRFAAAHAAKNQWNEVAGVYRKGMCIAMLTSAGAAVAVFSSASIIADHIFSTPSLVSPLRVMTVAIVPMSLLTLHGEMLRALGKIRDALLVQSVGHSSICLVLLVVLAPPFQVLGATGAYTLSAIAMLGVGIYFWNKATPQLKGVFGRFDLKLLLATSLPLFWVAVMNLVMVWTDTLMLGVWMDSASVGIYAVALRMAMLTSFIIVATNSVIVPKFAALYAMDDHESLGALARDLTKVTTLLASPILLVCVVFPSWLLGFFGSNFLEGSTSLSILAGGQFINVATGSVGYLLMMSGYGKLMRNNIMACSTLNVILNVWLIPMWGLVGAATATAVSLVVMNVISAILVYRKLAIYTIPLPKGIFARNG
jgi:O-antigen/teichoic acid export membrane protein